MPSRMYAAYKPVAPYFELARRALGDLVDGAHFFDLVDDNTVYEVLYDLGWPRVIRGRTALMAQFRAYAENIEKHRGSSRDAQDGRRTCRGHRIRGPWIAPGDGHRVQQPLLLDHSGGKPQDRPLAGLHGLARGVERVERAQPVA